MQAGVERGRGRERLGSGKGRRSIRNEVPPLESGFVQQMRCNESTSRNEKRKKTEVGSQNPTHMNNIAKTV